MNKIRFSLLTLLCVFASLTNAQNKYALLIGVSKYPANDSKMQFWGNLSSDKDLDLLKKTLPKQGFSSEHVFTLENEEVTPKGVEKAVDNLCQQITEGDIVILHFSGHGQQITDLDLAEDDGYDEAFVCYNAPTKYYDGYKGEDHLTDDQINVLISKIREKLGSKGHLLVLFDSCHSGNMTRGGNELTKRGGEGKMVIPNEVIKTLEKVRVSEGYSDWIHSEDDRTDLSSFCAISGCLPGEVNFQILDKSNIQYGSLTYAFCEVMKQPGLEKLNYQDVSLRIKQIIQNKVSQYNQSQHPSVEGNLNNLFLSGKAIGIKPYFEISEIRANEVTIDAGLLDNLNLGDSLIIKGGNNNNIAKGKITSINASQCILYSNKVQTKLKQPVSNYTAEVMTRNLVADFIPINIKGSKKHVESIRDSISQLYGYNIVEDTLQAKMILEIDKNKTISLYKKNQPNVFIRKIQNQPFNQVSAIKKELEAYFLIERFSNLELIGNNDVSISFQRYASNVPNKDNINYVFIDSKYGYTHPLEWIKGVPGMMNEKELIQVNIQTKIPTYMVIINILNGEITTTKSEKLTARPLKTDQSNTFWLKVDKGDLYKIIISDRSFNLLNSPAVIQGKSNLSRGTGDATDFLFPKTNSSRGHDQEFTIFNFNVETP